IGLRLDIDPWLGSDGAMSRQYHLPTDDAARTIVAKWLGWHDAGVRRFTTGLAFFVYDVWQGTEKAVVRIGRPEQAHALVEGLTLWQRLIPLGVPLPRVMVDGTADEMPFVIM